MSKYAYDKYGTASIHPPKEFQIHTEIEEPCPGCDQDIYCGDWVAYWDGKLMHENCADDEWELGE